MKKRIFLTSDNHFWHKNILEYEDRPFGSVGEMNEAMVSNWNDRVRPQDVIVHLGDFSLGNSAQTKDIMSRLNGTKPIIMGSLDRKAGWFVRNGFFKAYDNSFLLHREYILTHEPLGEKDLRYKLNIHGHLHSKRINDEYYFNVCVENWGYKPVSLEYIMAVTRQKGDRNEKTYC